MPNSPSSPENRIPPRFNPADFSLGCDKPEDLQHIIAELMRDYQPGTMVEVILIQRVALMHWKSLHSARLEVGVLRRNVQRCQDDEQIMEHISATPVDWSDPEAPLWPELLGTALDSDDWNGKSFRRAVNSAPYADRELHRCLNRLGRLPAYHARKPVASAPSAREPVSTFAAA